MQQMTETVKETAPDYKTAPRRKIGPYDIDQMAQYFRDGCNDTEACQLAGIKYETWRNWKSKVKNQTRFNDVLSRLKAARKTGAFKCIENSANGINVKYPDWRAAEALLRLTDPERFDPQRNSPSVTVNLGISAHVDLDRIAGRVYGGEPKAIEARPEPKQITDSAEKPT